MKVSGTIDITTIVLMAGVAFFIVVIEVDEIFFKDDSQLFQVLAGVVSALIGAVLARVKPVDSHDTDAEKEASKVQSNADSK